MQFNVDARYRLLNVTRGTVIATEVRVAHSLWARSKGLLGRERLRDGEGLVIPRCRSLHTWGMRFSIDVLFVDRAWKIVMATSHVRPWRIVGPVWRAWGVVETASGNLERSPLAVGDQLHLEPLTTS